MSIFKFNFARFGRSLRAAEKVIAKTQAVIEDLDRQRDALAQAQQVMVGELDTMKACLERYLRVKEPNERLGR